jgi:hypothetical protein
MEVDGDAIVRMERFAMSHLILEPAKAAGIPFILGPMLLAVV